MEAHVDPVLCDEEQQGLRRMNYRLFHSFCASTSAESRRFNVTDQGMRSQLSSIAFLVYRNKARSGMAPANQTGSGITWKAHPSAPRLGTPSEMSSLFLSSGQRFIVSRPSHTHFQIMTTPAARLPSPYLGSSTGFCTRTVQAEKRWHTKSAPKEQPRTRDDTIPPLLACHSQTSLCGAR